MCLRHMANHPNLCRRENRGWTVQNRTATSSSSSDQRVQINFCDLTHFEIYRVSRKWRTSDALRWRRDYRKREKNVKKILLDLFADLAVFESGT
jgi:hypothetical protein